ncbi:MAG: hypothetical protein KQH59_18215 [Desulfobulbaceae bacterium]|nr:hypothetical protein [Desulfobulbaceae bacterium]
MTTRADAVAALKAATTSTRLGQSVTIESVTLDAVRRTLSQEEVRSYGADGLAVEGIRLTFDPAALGFELAVGMACAVDGVEYEVKQVDKPAGNRRVTFFRYLS